MFNDPSHQIEVANLIQKQEQEAKVGASVLYQDQLLSSLKVPNREENLDQDQESSLSVKSEGFKDLLIC